MTVRPEMLRLEEYLSGLGGFGDTIRKTRLTCAEDVNDEAAKQKRTTTEGEHTEVWCDITGY